MIYIYIYIYYVCYVKYVCHFLDFLSMFENIMCFTMNLSVRNTLAVLDILGPPRLILSFHYLHINSGFGFEDWVLLTLRRGWAIGRLSGCHSELKGAQAMR